MIIDYQAVGLGSLFSAGLKIFAETSVNCEYGPHSEAEQTRQMVATGENREGSYDCFCSSEATVFDQILFVTLTI